MLPTTRANKTTSATGLLPDKQNCRLRMRRKCRDSFPRNCGLHCTCSTHVSWCILGSLNSGFLCRWRGKCSRHSQRMRNPQFCVSGKRPTAPVFAVLSVMSYWPTLPMHWGLHQWEVCIQPPPYAIRIGGHVGVRAITGVVRGWLA